MHCQRKKNMEQTIDEKLRNLIMFLNDNITILEYKNNNYLGKDNPDDIVALSLNTYDNMLPIFSKNKREKGCCKRRPFSVFSRRKKYDSAAYCDVEI